MAKKAPKKSTKKAAPKKAASKKAAKKATPKKAAAKKAAPEANDWSVVCSKQGTLKTGLTRAQAKAEAEAHEAETGHPTTFVKGQ